MGIRAYFAVFPDSRFAEYHGVRQNKRVAADLHIGADNYSVSGDEAHAFVHQPPKDLLTRLFIQLEKPLACISPQNDFGIFARKRLGVSDKLHTIRYIELAVCVVCG